MTGVWLLRGDLAEVERRDVWAVRILGVPVASLEAFADARGFSVLTDLP